MLFDKEVKYEDRFFTNEGYIEKEEDFFFFFLRMKTVLTESPEPSLKWYKNCD